MEQAIVRFAKDIWGSILGLEVTPTDRFAPSEIDKTLVGFIQITGDWEGTVSVHYPASLARSAAATMFDIDEKRATMEQIQDALGELTNMVGGNIKSLLPEHEHCHLSLPAVVVTEHQLHIPGAVEIARVPFACQDQQFAVILQKRGGTPAATLHK